MLDDEGYSDDENLQAGPTQSEIHPTTAAPLPTLDFGHLDHKQRGELATQLLGTLSLEQLAEIHRRLSPLLQRDIVGILPTETALQVLSYLPVQALVQASLVNRRWHALTNDQTLWKRLCEAKGWHWKRPTYFPDPMPYSKVSNTDQSIEVDEGFGDDDTYAMLNSSDDPRASTSTDTAGSSIAPEFNYSHRQSIELRMRANSLRHSAPPVLPSPKPHSLPDYKSLFRTRTILRQRLRAGSFRLSTLHSPARARFPLIPGDTEPTQIGHSSTIYALCLTTDPRTSEPTLFTASRDQTILQWDLSAPPHSHTVPSKVFRGAHTGSVLSICVSTKHGYLISGGSDGRIVVWSLRTALPLKIMQGNDGHLDSVLCVRCDDQRIASCSKDRTIRTYLLPSLAPHLVLRSHRAAVNALALESGLIVSASGDRSLRLWNAETGDLLRVFEGHHTRGLASIDFCLPDIVTGSSDRQIRLFDLGTQRGWSTDPSRHLHVHPHHHNLAGGGGAGFHPPGPGLIQMFPMMQPNTNGSATTTYSSSAMTQYEAVIARALDAGGHTGESVASILRTEDGEVCATCNGEGRVRPIESFMRGHHDLVRAVAMDGDVVLSASYDSTIKVWDRKTGRLLADLVGGHTGRIFGIAFDCTKIVSCGEDERITIWDFGWGMDTSFVKL